MEELQQRLPQCRRQESRQVYIKGRICIQSPEQAAPEFEVLTPARRKWAQGIIVSSRAGGLEGAKPVPGR